MRVAFYGNLCNNLFQIARALREQADIEAHLFLDVSHDMQMLPESDDPSLAGNYPYWIHQGNYRPYRTRMVPWTSSLIPEFSKFDVLFVSEYGPTFAQFVDRPSCFLSTGSDLTLNPFPIRSFLTVESPHLKTKLSRVAMAYWQRRGIQKSTEIWTQPFAPFGDALQELGVGREKIVPTAFPLVVDTKQFRDDPDKDSDRNRVAEFSKHYDFVLFHPSRLTIRSDSISKKTGTWKRNDALLRGFARFLSQNDASNAVLVMPDRHASLDADLARQIIADLGIQDQVLWLTPPRPAGFTRQEMVHLYAASDVVADDFGVGWFGSVVLEALSSSRPVISYVNEDVMQQMYAWHPILNARTEDEIAMQLTHIYLDREYGREMGQQGRKWIEMYHAPESASRLYVERFYALAGRLGIHPQ